MGKTKGIRQYSDGSMTEEEHKAAMIKGRELISYGYPDSVVAARTGLKEVQISIIRKCKEWVKNIYGTWSGEED